MNRKGIGNKASDDEIQQGRVAEEDMDEQTLLEHKAFMKRLKHAGKIMSDLSLNPRVQKQDRAILARNLGYMYEREEKRNPSINELKLFRAAFGDDGGESRHKKRKRYIRFASDKKGRKDEAIFAANGKDYVNLAVALTKLSSSDKSSSDDDVKLSILRLVEGTEFDDRTGVAERTDLKLRKEFQSVLDGVVDKVTGAVDLDAMRHWLEDNPIDIEGWLGEAKSIKYGGISGLRDLDASEDYDGDCFSQIVPLVRIGAIISAYKPDGMMRIAYPKSQDFPEHFELSTILEKKLGIYVEDNQAYFEIFEGLNVPLSQHKDWIDSWEFEHKQVTTHPVAWLKRFVDLELRFDRQLDRWQACLAIRPDTDYDSGDLAVCEVLAAGLSNKHGRTIFRAGTDHDHSDIYASLIEETEKDWIFAVFTDRQFKYAPEDTDDPCAVTEGALRVFPGASAYKMVFQSLTRYGHKFIVTIKSFSDRFSPAQGDSIAGAILRNLAYAADEDRVDNLLLADARHKAGLVEALKNELEENYLREMQQSGYLKS
jgi:hypothetical protein